LVAASIRKVVVAGLDPNPKVAGQGLAQLHRAGIDVVLLPFNDPLAKAARDINLGFFSRMLRQRPWVRLKVAISMDGQTALHNGQSQWLTSEAARQDVHHWRAQSCAMLTGIGTVLADNPMMNVRLPHTTRQPALVVLDRQLRTPANAALFQTQRPIYVAHQASANPQRQAALTQAGAQLWCIDSSCNTAATPPHRTAPQLGALMQHMATQGWNNVHLEAGATLNASLLQADWVDEVLIYMAPKLLGQGMPLAHLPQWTHLQDALGFEWLDCHMVGQDMRLRARPAGRTDFLNALDVPLNLPQ
jgi:diaminohydroxyphosphoribosylaminopyrimidine deaminase/5-amino-6-(5-phosphoribosylamino)uracil reductase